MVYKRNNVSLHVYILHIKTPLQKKNRITLSKIDPNDKMTTTQNK